MIEFLVSIDSGIVAGIALLVVLNLLAIALLFYIYERNTNASR